MNTKSPSPNPALDKLKAQLATMSPEERQKTLRLLAQVVKKQVQDADGKK